MRTMNKKGQMEFFLDSLVAVLLIILGVVIAYLLVQGRGSDAGAPYTQALNQLQAHEDLLDYLRSDTPKGETFGTYIINGETNQLRVYSRSYFDTLYAGSSYNFFLLAHNKEQELIKNGPTDMPTASSIILPTQNGGITGIKLQKATQKTALQD